MKKKELINLNDKLINILINLINSSNGLIMLDENHYVYRFSNRDRLICPAYITGGCVKDANICMLGSNLNYDNIKKCWLIYFGEKNEQ